MTDKWQCCMCKNTVVITVKTITDGTTGRITIDPADKPLVKCCFRTMRNLTEAQYIKESSINDSGARG